MSNPDTVVVETTTVACDGDGPDGHPRVYLKLENQPAIDCPYCGRRFVLKQGAPAAAH